MSNFGALLEGVNQASAANRAEATRQRELSEQRTHDVLTSLAQDDNLDPEIRHQALAGMLSIASGLTPKGKGFTGSLDSYLGVKAPIHPAVQSVMDLIHAGGGGIQPKPTAGAGPAPSAGPGPAPSAPGGSAGGAGTAIALKPPPGPPTAAMPASSAVTPGAPGLAPTAPVAGTMTTPTGGGVAPALQTATPPAQAPGPTAAVTAGAALSAPATLSTKGQTAQRTSDILVGQQEKLTDLESKKKMNDYQMWYALKKKSLLAQDPQMDPAELEARADEAATLAAGGMPTSMLTDHPIAQRVSADDAVSIGKDTLGNPITKGSGKFYDVARRLGKLEATPSTPTSMTHPTLLHNQPGPDGVNPGSYWVYADGHKQFLGYSSERATNVAAPVLNPDGSQTMETVSIPPRFSSGGAAPAHVGGVETIPGTSKVGDKVGTEVPGSGGGSPPAPTGTGAGGAQGGITVRSSGLQTKPATVPDIDSMALQTLSGHRYIDTSAVSGEAKTLLTKTAADAGVLPVSASEARALQSLDTARMNLQLVLEKMQPYLAKSPAGRPLNALKNDLSEYFQTAPDLAAMQSLRPSAIATLKGIGGSGGGFRINKAEIENAVAGMPEDSDTLATGVAKIQNVLRMLDNAEAPLWPKGKQDPDAYTGEVRTLGGKTYGQVNGQMTEVKTTDGGKTYQIVR